MSFVPIGSQEDALGTPADFCTSNHHFQKQHPSSPTVAAALKLGRGIQTMLLRSPGIQMIVPRSQGIQTTALTNWLICGSVESGSEHKSAEKAQQKVCQYWLLDNCVHGEKCQDLHSWFCGNGFSMLGKLEGHNKAVTGIALPSGSNKLYSGSKDKTVRIWDCNSAQAWNSQTLDDLTLTGPVGQVHAMVVGNDTLFAGTEDGTILAWKSSSQTNCLELAASLKGHGDGVICLCVGTYSTLYSGSMDNTIRVGILIPSSVFRL